MATEKEKVPHMLDDIKEYINLKIRIISLSLAEQAVRTLAAILSGGTVILLLSLFLIFGSFAVAYAIGNLLGNNGWGFLAVGGFYLLLALITLAMRRKVIEPKMVDVFVKLIFKDTNNSSLEDGTED